MTTLARAVVFREPVARTTRPGQRAQADDAPDPFVIRVMTTLLVVSVVMQSFIIPVGGSLLFFDIVPQYVAVGVLLFAGKLTVSPIRLVLFLLSFGTAIILQVGVVRDSSLASMFLALFIYASYLGVVDVSKATYIKIISNFQYVALGISALVVLDIVVQLVHLDMPDINKVFPSGLLVQSYNYIQPLIYGSHINKPNAFFMLEASFASQFVALGLVIELALFHRWRMVLTFVVALFATFATTGVLLVLASLPFLGRRYWRSMLPIIIVMAPLVLAGAYASGWIELMTTRFENMDREGSSFSGRFVVPYTAMWDLAKTGSETDIIAGLGAGATTRVLELAEYTTISRSFLEYGVIFLVFFITYLNYCFFSTGVPFIMIWIVFINYHFLSGNFHLSSTVNYCFVLAAGYAVRPARRPAISQQLGDTPVSTHTPAF